MLVIQATKGFHFFFHHVAVVKAQRLNSNFFLRQLVVAKINDSKAAFAQMFHELESIHSHRVAEVFSLRVEYRLLVPKSFDVVLANLHSLGRENSNALLQCLIVVAFES